MDDIDPLSDRSTCECGGELGARGAHVVGHEDRCRPRLVGGEPRECGSDALHECGIELIGNGSADVVGLEDGGHRSSIVGRHGGRP